MAEPGTEPAVGLAASGAALVVVVMVVVVVVPIGGDVGAASAESGAAEAVLASPTWPAPAAGADVSSLRSPVGAAPEASTGSADVCGGGASPFIVLSAAMRERGWAMSVGRGCEMAKARVRTDMGEMKKEAGLAARWSL
jgi:hypothetical protein